MKKLRIILLLLLSFSSGAVAAEKDSLKVLINDYSMLGIQYSVGFSKPSFNPDRNCESIFTPVNFAIMYTQYGKMFGYMPYFGFQVGLQYNHEGYQFTINQKTGGSDCILGARRADMQTIKLPFLTHFHVDFWKMKIIAAVGVYGGYRFKIKRSDYVDGYYSKYEQYETSFHPNEFKFTYGLQGSAGLGFMFDPIELHFTFTYDYAFQTLHKPDVNNITLEQDEKSKYYYKWTYPTNMLISVGVYYQLSRREGLTNKQLKQQAREEVEQIYREALKKLDETVVDVPDEEIMTVETNEKDNGESR